MGEGYLLATAGSATGRGVAARQRATADQRTTTTRSTDTGAAPGRSAVVTNLVRAARVLLLALPVVDLTDEEEHHIRRLARYLIAEADRPRPDEQRIQLLGTLLRTQLQQGPAAATLGAVLADSFDEALNGPADPAEKPSAAPYYQPRRTAGARRTAAVKAVRLNQPSPR